MRLPLLATLIILAINISIDCYIWKRISQSCRPKWAHTAYGATAFILNFLLLLAICVPKRSGNDSNFELIMWTLYAYFSVYIPKFLFFVFDLLASVPLLWHRRRIKALSIVGLILGAATFGLMWWGALINRFNIQVNKVEINIPNLPKEFDGFTIAQLSDLHTGTFGTDTTFIQRIVDKTNSLQPDLIAFTGDIVNRRTSEIHPFVNTLSKLTATHGVFSVLGNHDYGDYFSWPTQNDKESNLAELIDIQKRMGWNMLNNSTIFINRGNDSIAIIGVENVGEPPFHSYGNLDEAYPTLDDSNIKILLSHNPSHWLDDIKDSPDKNIALTLSGHTHAMQISLFGKSPAAFRYPTWGGLYADGDSHQLYVNIGMGEVAVPARIGATPEITLFTLRSK